MRRYGGRGALAARGSSSPRVRVAALALLDGKVVTVRHRRGDATYHLLPGGGVNFGETLSDALIREVEEETGLRATIGRPLIINDTIDPSGNRHIVNITFAATVEGTVTTSPDDSRVEAVDLIDPARFEDLDFRPPIAREITRALGDPLGFMATYAGSPFTPEQGA